MRAAAVESLGKLKDPRAVEALVPLLQDDDYDVRRADVEALGQIGDARSIGPLVLALKDEQSSVRSIVGGALRRIDYNWEKSDAAKAVLPELKAALKDKEYWVRQAAAQAMQKISDVRAQEPALLGGMTDPLQYKRQAAADALLEALGDLDRDLRQAAAEGLGRIGDGRANESLVEALQDPDRWVRTAAAQALESLQWQPADESQRLLQAKLLGTAIADAWS